MTVTAVVGAQWGDEGKGRIVDYLAQEARMVIRFQGGDNAGHTVVNEHGTFRLHLVPSGIFNPATVCIIGTGTVIHPPALLEELAELVRAGVSVDNLWLSDRSHVVMPYHRMLDGLAQSLNFGGSAQGTRGRYSNSIPHAEVSAVVKPLCARYFGSERNSRFRPWADRVHRPFRPCALASRMHSASRSLE